MQNLTAFAYISQYSVSCPPYQTFSKLGWDCNFSHFVRLLYIWFMEINITPQVVVDTLKYIQILSGA